jgi:CRP-like cAMP-binding protein
VSPSLEAEEKGEKVDVERKKTHSILRNPKTRNAGSYPTVLRRRALRHLYLSTLRRCYLFEGGRQRFVDALLAAAHVELLMPGVEVVADGDHVAELIVCVSGSLEALDVDGNSGNPNSSSHGGGRYGSMGYDSSLRGGDAFIGGPGGSPAVMAAGGGSWPAPAAPGSGAAFPRSADSSLQGGAVPGPASDNPEAGLSPTIVASASRAQAGSFHLPSLAVARQLGEGDAVGEVSFFTEVPQCGAVRTLTVARVLCIPRARYEVIARDFPLGTRAVLENLRKRAAAVVDAAFGGDQLAAAAATAQAQQAQQAQDSTAASAAAGAGGSTAAPPKGAALGASGASGSQWLSASQERALADSLRIKALASSALARTDERRTSEFLSAASRGDATTVRLMLNQNFNANTADYDGRTALMLASAKGHREVVTLLLSSRADPSATDNLGGSALLEAARHGHDAVLDALVAGGARWHLSTVATASELCTCVFECHMPLLRW